MTLNAKPLLVIIGLHFVSTISCDKISNHLSIFLKDIEYFNYMCTNKTNYTLGECFMIKSLKQLDRSLNSPVIELNENARLVDISMENKSINISKYKRKKENFFNSMLTKSNARTVSWNSWATTILGRLKDVFRTHVLHLNLLPAKKEDVTGRHRRRHQMLPMMLLGVVSVAVVIIPMGFQFLAVIAGKAFLMAKMALILASVNGLKRVASSGVHYGLYHTDGYHYPHMPPPASHFSQYWHDRDGRVE